MRAVSLVPLRSCQYLLADTAMVSCILILVAVAVCDVLSFVLVHREILLVEILNS